MAFSWEPVKLWPESCCGGVAAAASVVLLDPQKLYKLESQSYCSPWKAHTFIFMYFVFLLKEDNSIMENLENTEKIKVVIPFYVNTHSRTHTDTHKSM